MTQKTLTIIKVPEEITKNQGLREVIKNIEDERIKMDQMDKTIFVMHASASSQMKRSSKCTGKRQVMTKRKTTNSSNIPI